MENIKPKTLHALCLFYGINVFYVHNNTYYDINVNVEKPTNVIRYNPETHDYSVSVTTTPTVCEYIEKIKENNLRIDNLEKPIRTITSYSIAAYAQFFLSNDPILDVQTIFTDVCN